MAIAARDTRSAAFPASCAPPGRQEPVVPRHPGTRQFRREHKGQYPSVRAPGTKRINRNRSIYITEPWCWEIFGAWLHQQPALPGAPVFTIGYDGAAAALKRALDAAEIDDYKPHDWRHTYAVQALRDGLAAQTVAHQLGHKDATMVLKVYGRFVPNRADYERHRLTIGQTVGPRLYVAQTPKAVSR